MMLQIYSFVSLTLIFLKLHTFSGLNMNVVSSQRDLHTMTLIGPAYFVQKKLLLMDHWIYLSCAKKLASHYINKLQTRPSHKNILMMQALLKKSH